MRTRLQTSMVCLVMLLGGCKPDQDKPEQNKPEPTKPKQAKPAVSGACDQAALASLVERLDSVEPGERVRVVSAGLLDACAALLPATTAFYLREANQPSTERVLAPDGSKDEALHNAKGLACPKREELDAALQQASARDRARTVYEVCDYQRYGLIPPEEFATHSGSAWLTWTTHALLLDAGTPPELAKPITRALFLLEAAELGSNLITPLEGQRLPNIAGGTQIPEGVVIYASMTELVVNDRPLAALQDGVPAAEVVHRHVILPLREHLEEEAAKARIVAEARGEAWSGRMLLAFDGRVPFSTVVDTMYTGGRTGFTSYAFIIQANPVERALLVAPPRSNASGDPGPRMELLIADDKLWVDVPGERRKLPKRESAGSGAEAWDQPGLAAIVGEFKQANPGASTAVVYAENHIPLEVLLGTFATLAGPGCDQAQPETCLLPDLIIMGGAG